MNFRVVLLKVRRPEKQQLEDNVLHPHPMIKYLHLVKVGSVEGVMVDLPEAVSIQHPAAMKERSCHFSPKTSPGDISHVFVFALLFHMLCWAAQHGSFFNPDLRITNLQLSSGGLARRRVLKVT